MTASAAYPGSCSVGDSFQVVIYWKRTSGNEAGERMIESDKAAGDTVESRNNAPAAGAAPDSQNHDTQNHAQRPPDPFLDLGLKPQLKAAVESVNRSNQRVASRD